MPTITREQLESIEWALNDARDRPNKCPVCYMHRDLHGVHTSDCWLSAALATPDTLPPVEVGDVVTWRADGIDELLAMTIENAQDVQDASDIPEILAIYRTPLWQRGKA